MSIFSDVFGLAKGAIDKLGPLLPMLLSLIQTKTNEHDREGILHVASIFNSIGDAFHELGSSLTNAVDESSPGGTAITGNEYAGLVSLLDKIKKDIDEASKV